MIRPNKHTTKLFFFLCLLLLFRCDNPKKPTNTLEILASLSPPSLGLFGDSFLADWPAEEKLKPFRVIKNAFPGRKMNEIYHSASTDKLTYDVCITNGGINDYLGRISATNEEIQTTIDLHIKTIYELTNRCRSMLVLNLWQVELPWPVEAVNQLNQQMKNQINFVKRLDTDRFITKAMLSDGGHLNEFGYRTLSRESMKELRILVPVVNLLLPEQN
ncbi:SGNH/GDSL hydrolase family protein [Leptospira sp. 96542]|nr:SGNH/GDSL hydrolase family protein [Leptospira sp. 96542]